jgi:hypothetical protein
MTPGNFTSAGGPGTGRIAKEGFGKNASVLVDGADCQDPPHLQRSLTVVVIVNASNHTDDFALGRLSGGRLDTSYSASPSCSSGDACWSFGRYAAGRRNQQQPAAAVRTVASMYAYADGRSRSCR